MRWRRRLFELSLVIGAAALLTLLLGPAGRRAGVGEPPPRSGGILSAEIRTSGPAPGAGHRSGGAPGLAPERTDLAEGREGSPLALRFTIQDSAGQPLPGTRLEVWHADASGSYSQPPETFGRGAQVTDARGRAAFATVQPGREGDQGAHVHFRAEHSSGLQRSGAVDVPASPGPGRSAFGVSSELTWGDGVPTLEVRLALEPGTCSSHP